MDPHTGNSASAAGPKKDKKSKKNYEDGDGKKKFVSIHRSKMPLKNGLKNVSHNSISGYIIFLFQVKLQRNKLPPYL